MSESYILSIDQSTSGTKSLLFDREGQLVARCDLPHEQISPQPGWVEHDPEEIYRNVIQVTRMVLEKAGVQPEQVVAAGVSNQRETGLIWNRISGKPVCNAVVWQCARAEQICEEIRAQGKAETVRHKTGLQLSPYFTAAKLTWIIRNIPGAKESMDRGELMGGNIDGWLLFKLTGGKVHKTDYSNASRTQLLNLETLRWDEELCEIFGLNPNMLPEICYSDSEFCTSDFEGVFPKPIPVHGVLGDSHAALFGQGCLVPGTAKATYGTGSSVMMNTGKSLIHTDTGLVTSIGWGMNGQVDYVLEGNLNYTGSVIKWLVENLHMISSSKESGSVATSVPDNGGVYLVPAFSGLGAPYWDSNARAVICGMNRDTTSAHIVRAGEECIAYQIKDIVDLMCQEAKVALQELNVDGGPTRDKFLMQFQADMLGIILNVPAIEELSGAGAAYAAGIAVGFFDKERLFASKKAAKFTSAMEESQREALYGGWKKAVASVLTK